MSTTREARGATPDRGYAGMPPERELVKVHCCDFCGKRAEFVELMIAGAGGDICNECVDVCVEVIASRRAEKAQSPPAA